MTRLLILALFIFCFNFCFAQHNSRPDTINNALISELDKDALYNLDTAMNWSKINALLRLGAVIKIKNSNGQSLLYLAVKYGQDSLSNWLLDKGVNVNDQNVGLYGNVLNVACEYQRISLARLLIKKGADANQGDDLGRTPLSYITDIDDTLFASMLLTAGAEINHPETGGYSALFGAVANNDLKLAKFLIEHGAIVNYKTDEGKTPLDFAISKEMKKLLKKAGAAKGEN